MTAIDAIWTEFKAASPLLRDHVMQKVERDYGKGFADRLRDEFETALIWEENERIMKK